MHRSRFATLFRSCRHALRRAWRGTARMVAPVEDRLCGRYADQHSNRLERLICSFTTTERIVFGVCVLALILASGVLAWRVGMAATVETPSRGGSLTEGVVGSPRFINPLLAESDADRDLAALVYAGLLKRQPDGDLAYELARDITISTSSMRYTVTLREDARFHDGEPVTARDVVYTVRQAKDPQLKTQLRSELQGNWTGVTVSSTGPRTVLFELDEPYAPFIQNLTLGILPAHIWKPLSPSQFPSSPHNDATPVGAGPFRVADFDRDNTTALATYKLEPFDDYVLGPPFLKRLTIRSFANETELADAVSRGTVDSAGGLDAATADGLANEGHRVRNAPLPRIFAVFFNHNQNDIFTSRPVRTALANAVDKDAIIQATLNGFGTPVNSPVPAGMLNTTVTTGTTTAPISSRIRQASSTLAGAGWQLDDNGIRSKDGASLAFTLTTSDTPELVSAANLLQDQWKTLGADVSVEVYSSSNLNRDVIRPRSYDALLFGKIVGWGRDFYPFWHSSQQNDPGLNIAQYANIDVDGILEELRRTHDPRRQEELLQTFARTVSAEQPAAFLYTPSYPYVLPEKVQNARIAPLVTPRERFSTVHRWYLDTERTLRIFADEMKRTRSETVF